MTSKLVGRGNCFEWTFFNQSFFWKNHVLELKSDFYEKQGKCYYFPETIFPILSRNLFYSYQVLQKLIKWRLIDNFSRLLLLIAALDDDIIDYLEIFLLWFTDLLQSINFYFFIKNDDNRNKNDCYIYNFLN